MHDPVREGFLKQQLARGLELAGHSDLLELIPQDIDRYLAVFHCKGLVRAAAGEIVEASDFRSRYLVPIGLLPSRRSIAGADLAVAAEHLASEHPPAADCVCGKIAPATELCDLLYQCYEIIAYLNWAPHDGLNPEACQWARNHQHLLPVDRRPLKRRVLDLQIKEVVPTP